MPVVEDLSAAVINKSLVIDDLEAWCYAILNKLETKEFKFKFNWKFFFFTQMISTPIVRERQCARALFQGTSMSCASGIQSTGRHIRPTGHFDFLYFMHAFEWA